MAPSKTRPLPSNPDAEIALLSACFLRPEIISQVRQVLSPEDFYLKLHLMIFNAFLELGKQADPSTVVEYLTKQGLPDNAGFKTQIADIADYVPTSAGWSYHAGIIKELSIRRQIISACAIASDDSYGLDDPSEILSSLKESIRNLNTDTGKPYRDNRELINAVWKDIERRNEEGAKFVGLPTGFKVIDDQVYGLEPRTTTYLVARPSTGKTALALNIAENVEGRVLFFSLESNAEAITRRRMAAKSKIFLWRLRTAQLEDGQYPRLLDACNALCESQVIIFDKPAFRWIENLTAQCESMAMDGPIKLIVIDHIGRCRTKRKAENQNILLGIISDEIADLAKNLNVPLLVLCQLNREIEKRTVKQQYPRLSDIRECVTGGTEIYTNKGPRTIKAIFQRNQHCNFTLGSYDQTNGAVNVRPEKVLNTGMQRCFRIRTKSGYMIAVSEGSRLLTKDGWKMVSDLTLGDSVLVDKSKNRTRKGVRLNHGNSHFEKGFTPWNAGLTKETDKRVNGSAEKSSGKRNGAIKSKDFPSKMRQINPPIGKKRAGRGYILVYHPEWPSSRGPNGPNSGYVFEHRYIMETHLGRIIKKSEIVHHLDGDKENNVIENLLLCRSPSEHEHIHQLEQRFTEDLIKKGMVYYDYEARCFRFR